MKLSKIYSNYPKVFLPINFNDGLNVVFGKVLHPTNNLKDSHNLGKSTLIELIDFLLLKENLTTHFLEVNKIRFTNHVFFLEIQLAEGEYVTVRRSVDSSSKIAFKKHTEKDQNFCDLSDGQWDNSNVPIATAQGMLDGYLALDAIGKWSYRKGVSYFLRTQADYLDVFQIAKYAKGRHSEWKPYLSKLLGFNDALVIDKYDLEEQIKSLEANLAALNTNLTEGDYDPIRGKIEIKDEEVQKVETQLDSFNFSEEELKLNKQLVERIEVQISAKNEALYNLGYEISQIEKSLSVKFDFNVEEMVEIFNEAQIYFPDKLKKEYSDLVSFNKQITKERTSYLKTRLGDLRQQELALFGELKSLNTSRQNNLSILKELDSLTKFKQLQKLLAQEQATLNMLNVELEMVKQIIKVNNLIRDNKKKLEKVVDELRAEEQKDNPVRREIRLAFCAIIKSVLNVNALLAASINSSGNIDFRAAILEGDDASKATSQDRGTSYKKLLCAAFDLAVLRAYATKKFFHFVYHDGVLEGLDDRKKVCLLENIRKYCSDYGIQYILTAIDSDLPRDPVQHNKLEFAPGEIVLELNDGGDDGRLFRMPKF